MSGTPPPPPSTPPPPQPPGTGFPGRSPRLIALCAVLGALLAISVTAIVVLLVVDGGDPEPGSGEAYAVATCDFVEGLPGTIDPEELNLEEPVIWQLQAVAATATAAGHSGDEYDAYLEVGEEMQAGTVRLDLDVMMQRLDDLRSECEENPPG